MTIRIPEAILDGIRTQGRAEAPNEACGYLLGGDGRAQLQHPMTNVDHSPVHFSLDPEEQFAALARARSLGLDLLAVYHTHPETPARMSDEDIRLARDPKAVYAIYSIVDDDLKAFRVPKDREVSEVKVEILVATEKKA